MSDTRLPVPETPEAGAVLRAFLEVGAILGGSLEWGGDHLEYIGEAYDAACRKLGLPRVGDQDETAHRYWAAVGDRYGIEHDDMDELYGSDDDDEADA